MSKMKFYALWISLLIIIIFALQSFIPGFTELFRLDQNNSLQIWRFATSIFLHGSLLHLTYNLFALILFGLILEKLIGSKKFLFVFILSGILANIISINFYNSSLGASGTIMGIIGALVIIKPLMTVWAFGMIMPMFAAAILWVIGDIIGIFMPDKIGHITHISGIIFGIFLGIIFRLNHHVKKKKQITKVPEHILRRWETLYMK